MDHGDHHHDHGGSVNAVAISATLHCLTGCALGEITGMVIGSALGWSDIATIALAVTLAFLFGYTLTSIPLLRAGFALSAVIPLALASDTVSIAVMEVVDNVIMVLVPGAMEAGVGNLLFWGALAVALVVAFAAAVPFNIWLIKRGKGHAVIHETGVHGGPPVRVVAAAVIAAAIFGSVVLTAEAVDGDEPAAPHETEEGHGGDDAAAAAPVRGLSERQGGLRLRLAPDTEQIRFRILDPNGNPLHHYEVQHEREMHLIVVRRDLRGFQHLHPRLERGTWSIPVRLGEPGTYRVYADFRTGGRNYTLADDLRVPGTAEPSTVPDVSALATDGGYSVRLHRTADGFAFDITRAGERVEVQPYLGALGHLVVIRRSDLAYLHVHPEAGAVAFETELPGPGTYAAFLQFRHEDKVHTASFTVRE